MPISDKKAIKEGSPKKENIKKMVSDTNPKKLVN